MHDMTNHTGLSRGAGLLSMNMAQHDLTPENMMIELITNSVVPLVPKFEPCCACILAIRKARNN